MEISILANQSAIITLHTARGTNNDMDSTPHPVAVEVSKSVTRKVTPPVRKVPAIADKALLDAQKALKAELAKPTSSDVATLMGKQDRAKATFNKLTASDVSNADMSKPLSGGASTAKADVSNRIDYVSNLLASVDKGISSLVQADMKVEAARLSALRIQQQLGNQTLSIANQGILSLFCI